MRHTKMFLSLAAMALSLLSCSDEKIDYPQAEPIPADNWGVYFDGLNSSEFPRTADEPNTLALTLKRVNTNGTLTVPLESDIRTGSFQMPESVTFADGEDKATVSVTYDSEDLKKGRLLAYLSIPEIYINPYAQKKGFYKQSILVYEPLKIGTVRLRQNKDDGSIAETDGLFDGVEGLITQVPGENRFFWTNFLGSGATFSFKLDKDDTAHYSFDEDDITKCKGPIIPLTHYVMYKYDESDENSMKYWYYCEEERAADMDIDDVSLFTWSFTNKGVERQVTDCVTFLVGWSYAKIDFTNLYKKNASGNYVGATGRLYGITVDDLLDDYWIYVYPITEQ